MPLPNFLLIGFGRAGTTSLYHYLKQHPDIYMSPVKEPKYFAFDFTTGAPVPPERAVAHQSAVKTLEDYQALFAGVTGEKAIGEASPQYVVYPGSAERIRRQLSDPRLVVTLRHPAERLYSHYLFEQLADMAPRQAFDDALKSEAYRLEGSYATLLRSFYERFAKERMHVILFEDLAALPLNTVKDLYRFLEVDPAFDPDVGERHNPSRLVASEAAKKAIYNPGRLFKTARLILPKRLRGVLRAKLIEASHSAPPPLAPETRHQITERFRGEILQLQELTGRDLSHWLE